MIRVTEGMTTDTYLYNNNKIAAQKLKIQTELATNSKIATLSDDLPGALESIKIEMQIKRTENYLKNADDSKDFINSSLTSLTSITDQLQKVMPLVTSTDDPLNKQNYPTIVQSIKDSLQQMVSAVNTKHNDMYLFGGTNYSAPPVSIDASGKAVLTANDLSGEVKVQISSNMSNTMNIPGNKIFDTKVFESLNSIIDSLTAGTTPTQTQQSDLNDAYNKLLGIESLAGENLNRISDSSDVLNTRLTNYKELLVKKQEINPQELVVDLQNQDYLLQMSYKLLSQQMQKSILQYI